MRAAKKLELGTCDRKAADTPEPPPICEALPTAVEPPVIEKAVNGQSAEESGGEMVSVPGSPAVADGPKPALEPNHGNLQPEVHAPSGENALQADPEKPAEAVEEPAPAANSEPEAAATTEAQQVEELEPTPEGDGGEPEECDVALEDDELEAAARAAKERSEEDANSGDERPEPAAQRTDKNCKVNGAVLPPNWCAIPFVTPQAQAKCNPKGKGKGQGQGKAKAKAAACKGDVKEKDSSVSKGHGNEDGRKPGRTSKRKAKDEEEVEEEQVPKRGRTSKRKAKEEEEVEEEQAPKRGRTSKRKAKEEEEEEDNESKGGKATKRKAKEEHKEPATAAKGRRSKAKGNTRDSSSSSSRSSSKPKPSGSHSGKKDKVAEAKAQKVAETKARRSRKSMAYVSKYKAALKEGADEEEARELAREARL